MSSNDYFKNRNSTRRGRKVETREPNPNSFLIVTEGKKTEPQYFTGLRNYINSKYGRGIDVEYPQIDIEGEGKGTVKLVEEAIRIVARAKKKYSQVWVVFDKDDFTDFDEAIKLAEKNGYKVAWSNPSFEYWIYLHFQYSTSVLRSSDWVDRISKIFIERKIDSQGYRKSNPDVFDLVTTHGSLKSAIYNADRSEQHHSAKPEPSKCNPCTKVQCLIRELEPYIKELIE